jgi:hypothetical protein
METQDFQKFLRKHAEVSGTVRALHGLFVEQREKVIRKVHDKDHPADWALYRIISGKRVDKHTVDAECGMPNLDTDVVYVMGKPCPAGIYRGCKFERASYMAGSAERFLRMLFRWAGANPILYIEVRWPKKIPYIIETGFGFAVLLRTGRNEGFGDACGIDFETGIVKGNPAHRKYYEFMGFEFWVADEEKWPEEAKTEKVAVASKG